MSEVMPSDAAQPLIELARRHTRGETSPRRHQASRAIVLDRMDRKKRSPLLYAFVGLALVGGGSATFASVKHYHVTHAAPVVTEAASAPFVIDVQMPPETTTGDHGVKLQAWPDGATLYWDDKKVEGNPHSFRFEPDGKPHRVRAEAPGHQPLTRSVVMDSPYSLIELQLRPRPVTVGTVTASAAIIDANSVVDDMRDSFESCFVDALAWNPASPIGRVTLILKVSDQGKIESTTTENVEGLAPGTLNCISKAITDSSPTVRTTGPGTLTIPLTFAK